MFIRKGPGRGCTTTKGKIPVWFDNAKTPKGKPLPKAGAK